MLTTTNSHSAVCLALTRAIGKALTVEEIYAAALDALCHGVRVERSSILLFDPDGVMRFKASRGLSTEYRAAVEGHTPWTPDARDPEPIVVPNVAADPSLGPFMDTIQAEGIAAMAFIPLVSLDRVIGKFMLYYATPRAPSADALQLACVIAAQVAFAVVRTRTEEQARRSEERLRFALDAASMGTWDWNLITNSVRWSDNLEQIHGLPPGTFDGTFASYEQEIHPDDRPRVLASVQRALSQGVPHEVEYRIVAPDGTVRWCEGKGRVEYHDGRPVRMSGVCMMVTRRKEAENARLAAAEEANRLKDEFLATLSHELRTPLNAILGWTQMLQSGNLSPDRAGQAVDVIGRNARLQGQLIDDILDVSRIITGKFEIERAPVSIPQLIETAVSAVAPAAASRQIAVGVQIAPEVPPIEGDPKRLSQVLNNVLSNALKFTPPGGRIDLTCRVQEGTIHIEVSDSGVGIDSAFLPYVFDRFRQGDSRSTRRHGGLGLGLAITKHLVTQHGGEIEAFSDGPGRGTSILIQLPADSHGAPGAPHGSEGRVTGRQLHGTTTLVVDDQADSRELVAALLEQHGAQVIQCDSAASALEVIASREVQVLIADIAMPEVDGYALIEHLRARGFNAPAIAVTAYARPQDREHAMASGYSGYCAKPVDAAQLVSLVRTVISRTGQSLPQN
jgi:PAS domain S-box-containing protein